MNDFVNQLSSSNAGLGIVNRGPFQDAARVRSKIIKKAIAPGDGDASFPDGGARFTIQQDTVATLLGIKFVATLSLLHENTSNTR